MTLLTSLMHICGLIVHNALEYVVKKELLSLSLFFVNPPIQPFSVVTSII